MMNEWNIQARATACQACERPFADKQPYHTLLFDERQALLRQDICDACWQQQFSHGAGDRKGFVSRWQGVFAAPPPPAPEAIQKDTAESLLRKLMELNDPRHEAASYILAVMLERKRIFKVKEQFVRERRRTFVYEHPRTGDVFTIPDPDLHLDQLEAVQRDVAALLEHGLAGPPASTDASAAPLSDSPAAIASARELASDPVVTAPEADEPSVPVAS